MKEKEEPMVKYGVDESELCIEKTAGRDDISVPSSDYHVTTSNPIVKVPWGKGKAKKKQ